MRARLLHDSVSMISGLVVVSLSLAPALPARAELTIETVAGTGLADDNGADGPALDINVVEPFGVAIGPDAALYFTEIRHHRVRRVDLATGQLTTVAGSGRKGYAGDGGPATQAELNEPYEVAFDPQGNLLFVEMKNNVIRRVDAKTGLIATIAGTGRPGFSGDGGPATAAQLNQPHGIAVDAAGRIYIADIGNHRVRSIDAGTGLIKTLAGNGERSMPAEGQSGDGPLPGPRALCVDGATLWIALREGNSVWAFAMAKNGFHRVAGTGQTGYSGDGGPPLDATFNGPKGLARDRFGILYVADTENHVIRRVDQQNNQITTIAGTGSAVRAPASEPRGSSPRSATTVPLNRPHSICVTPSGDALFIADTLNHRIRRVKLRDAAP
jgi:sugar lactone lactonase YvrE